MPGHSIKIFNITADTAVLALMAECGVKDLMLAQAARITAPRQRILMEHYNPLTGTTYFFIKFQNYPNPTDNGWLAFMTDATGADLEWARQNIIDAGRESEERWLYIDTPEVRNWQIALGFEPRAILPAFYERSFENLYLTNIAK